MRFTTQNAFHLLELAGVASAVALTLGCAQIVSTPCAEGEAAECSKGESAAAKPMPPAGYAVKWSTCTHFVEGDAKIRNNSRIVQIASDGTVPIQRVDPLSDPSANLRRVVVAKLPNTLLGGEGVLRSEKLVGHEAGSLRLTSTSSPSGDSNNQKKVSFVKLGQAVNTKEADGSIVQWVVGSEALAEPLKNDSTGRLEYQDTCFRSSKQGGKDTAGYIDESMQLAGTCIVEDMNRAYNALSATGAYAPLVNYSTMSVPTANNPATRPHPDNLATYEGNEQGAFWYTGVGAALNDINGAERDGTTLYFGGDHHCHMIVSGGLEVPGAKRPATKSLPFPGFVNGQTFDEWRPVSPNFNIANDQAPVAPDPIEPDPAPAPDPIPADDALPM